MDWCFGFHGYREFWLLEPQPEIEEVGDNSSVIQCTFHCPTSNLYAAQPQMECLTFDIGANENPTEQNNYCLIINTRLVAGRIKFRSS